MKKKIYESKVVMASSPITLIIEEINKIPKDIPKEIVKLIPVYVYPAGVEKGSELVGFRLCAIEEVPDSYF